MSKEVNSLGYPKSCLNCKHHGKSVKIQGEYSKYGICYNSDTKLEFIHNNEKSSCIMTANNAVCDKFEFRIK